MKQTMKWLFVKDEGESVVFRCSACNSEITVKYGEELPYCKHCESEPDGEQIAKKMTDNEKTSATEMTDNEIIKALEICILGDCSGCDCRCGSVGDCRDTLNKHSLDLITRQRAEIERLEKTQVQYVKAWVDEFVSRLKIDCSLAIPNGALLNNVIDELVESMKSDFSRLLDFTNLIQVKAVKEFAERLKTEQSFYDGQETRIYLTEKDLDNLVKEMVGEG